VYHPRGEIPLITVGLSPVLHESAVGVVIDGRVVAASSEERFSRVKNDGGFPHRSLEFVLRQAGVTPADVDHVAYAALPFFQERLRDVVGFGKNIAYEAVRSGELLNKLGHAFNYSRGLVLHKEWPSLGKTQRMIRRELARYELDRKMVFVDHHRAHVASAYYSSGFDRCLAVSLDGYGSGQAGSFYLGENGRLRPLSMIPYPHSLGTFYRRVTQALGFKPNRHEGKIVGLAAFGDPAKLYDQIRARFDLEHPDYFRFRGAQDPFYEKKLVDRYDAADIAAAYQRVLEDVATEYVGRWVRRTGVNAVACAGGVFANVKMNQRMMEIPEVEHLFVFPAMGDAGVGVGAALALQADVRGVAPRNLQHVYLGPEYTDSQMEEALVRAGLPFRRSPQPERDIARYLADNKVVARFNGAMEFGPRALGNRSILYPAIDPEVNKWLNARLARTEFMPFAPITIDDAADELYDQVERVRHAAEFMTVTVNCKPKMRRDSPAAVHVDGTARPQLVRQAINPSLHRILSEYRQLSGIPTLINTSYNMHEEPIVCSPDDAIRAFNDSKLEVLAMGAFLVESPSAAPPRAAE
jgi:carbamoyltransferase